MDLNPKVKIYKMIRKLKGVVNKQRQEFLSHLYRKHDKKPFGYFFRNCEQDR